MGFQHLKSREILEGNSRGKKSQARLNIERLTGRFVCSTVTHPTKRHRLLYLRVVYTWFSMGTRMKDIAKDLGVSVITVSKVLRNHPDVGDKTRNRVLTRVRELDYQPNLAARSLVTGRTYLVGLVVPDLLHPFFAEIAKSLSDALRKSGYYLIVSSSDEDPQLEEEEINQLLARRLDTLIIASCRTTVDLFFRIEKQHIPYVLIDRNLPGLAANFV